MLKKTFKLFWFFFTKFKKCAKNRQKISLNILGLICRIETEKRRPSSFKEYHYHRSQISIKDSRIPKNLEQHTKKWKIRTTNLVKTTFKTAPFTTKRTATSDFQEQVTNLQQRQKKWEIPTTYFPSSRYNVHACLHQLHAL